MPEPEMIDPQSLADWLEDGSAYLIDVREETEFVQARIPGSHLVPLSTFDPRALSLPEGRRIVLHCRSGVRCGHAAEHLIAAGETRQLYRLAGGIMAWAQQGQPIEPG